MCHFDHGKGIEYYVDAGFADTWSIGASDCASFVFSNGRLIKVANYPIFWVSKMQTEIDLSSAEAEYIALSQRARYLTLAK